MGAGPMGKRRSRGGVSGEEGRFRLSCCSVQFSEFRKLETLFKMTKTGSDMPKVTQQARAWNRVLSLESLPSALYPVECAASQVRFLSLQKKDIAVIVMGGSVSLIIWDL